MSIPQKPLSYAEAAAMVNGIAAQFLPSTRATETLPLLEAQGRVLAMPIKADRDQPPFARSTRDGFAGRADEWVAGALTLRGLLRAGESWQGGAIPPGSCIEIMTGAPVPLDVDCVVMVEHVERVAGEAAGESIRLLAGRTIRSGENIVPSGAEAAAGSTLLPAGTRLNAHGVAVAAACGAATVKVFSRPRVAILSTGDELVDVGDTPLLHQIRNSNSYTLAAQVLALGAEPMLAPPVADNAEALKAAIRNAASGCDLLLLSGGVSMGKYDLVEPALAALGGGFHFTGARIQPGKPVVFGSLPSFMSPGSGNALPFFGLPGNPVSTIVCFALFAAPLLAAIAGEEAYVPRFVQARLRGSIGAKPGLTRFLPARLTHAVDGAVVEQIAWQGSGDLASTARANCFLVTPEDAGQDLADGDTVTVLLA